MQEQGTGGVRHTVTLQDCGTLFVSGVQEVLSFDEGAVALSTPCGVMMVEGEGLHVGRLDPAKKECDVEGHITALFYTKTREKGGLFKRGREK